MEVTNNNMPKELIAALGGQEAVLKLPLLTLNRSINENKLHVRPSEMTASVMRGQDSAGRFFIVFKLDVFEDEDTLHKLRTTVDCIFKRSSDTSWISGDNMVGGSKLVKSEVMNPQDYAYIAKLLLGKELQDRSRFNGAVGDHDADMKIWQNGGVPNHTSFFGEDGSTQWFGDRRPSKPPHTIKLAE